jgi:hypothetical protein
MQNLISALLGIIRDEIVIYRELVEHVHRKTALLVQGSTEELLESNKIEETFNIKLRILEAEMVRLRTALSQKLGISSLEFTLLKLAEGTDPATAEEIRALTSHLKAILDQLKAVNTRNRKLIESSARYSRGLMDLISNATSSYQGSGLFVSYPAVPSTISHRA